MNVSAHIKKSINDTAHFLSQSLELWDNVGYDHKYGGYFEALDFQGNPLTDLDKRFRIHPRSIFAHSAGTIWGYYNGLEVAEKAFLHLTNNCWLPEGGFATLTNRKGDVLNNTIFTYDHAFVMLGFGWLYKASGNKVHQTWLYDTWDMLQSRLIHEDGGFITSIPEPQSPIRVQNPHMHMLEAILNLVELFDEDIWRDIAKKIYTLFERHFCLAHEGKIREFFNDDWSPDLRTGHLLEPGHHYEWVWILEKYETIMNESVSLIQPIYDFAILGSNELGLGYNQTDFEGNPVRPEHRMWIQTEVIKANLAMYRRTKDSKYLPKIYHAWQLLFEKFLIKRHYVWYDELDDTGNNISRNAPTSTLYHLVIALHEYIELAKTL